MKTIVVFQPITGEGHHDSYAELYCNNFLALGYRVILLSCGQNSLKISTKYDNFTQIQNVSAYPQTVLWKPSPKTDKEKGTYINRIINAYQYGGITEVLHRTILRLPIRGYECYKYLGPLEALRRIIQRIPIVGSSLSAKIMPRHCKKDWPVHWESLLKKVSQTQQEPDLFFVMYLDAYLLLHSGALRSLPIPWAGIMFQAAEIENSNRVSIKKDLNAKSSRGAIMLDDRYTHAYNNLLPNKHFITVPDAVNDQRRKQNSQLVQTILDKAAGRKIISLVGSLERRKGILNLIDAALLPESKNIFFVFVGKLYPETFGTSLARIQSFTQNIPNNCFAHFYYVADERDINEIIALSDALFTAYENFDASSNMLMKAATFNTPLLSPPQGLIADRVLKYKLGFATPSHDPIDIRHTIYKIFEHNWNEKDFILYREKHGKDKLHFELKKFLNKTNNHL